MCVYLCVCVRVCVRVCVCVRACVCVLNTASRRVPCFAAVCVYTLKAQHALTCRTNRPDSGLMPVLSLSHTFTYTPPHTLRHTLPTNLLIHMQTHTHTLSHTHCVFAPSTTQSWVGGRGVSLQGAQSFFRLLDRNT